MEAKEDPERLRRLLKAQQTEVWGDRQTQDDMPTDLEVSAQYQAEEKVLQAVAEGDIQAAYQAMYAFADMHEVKHFDQDPKGSRIWMTSFNDLLRRKVQTVKIHPSYINRVATYFSQEILSAETPEQFEELMARMLDEYCRLVRTYAMDGYSDLIRNVMNHVEFHIHEDLELNTLAELYAVSPAYLSRRFKQEAGMTLTEYVNQKRIERAMALLVVSDLPVSEVAATVGILDGNYFSRLFKKQAGLSPSRYRKEHKKETTAH